MILGKREAGRKQFPSLRMTSLVIKMQEESETLGILVYGVPSLQAMPPPFPRSSL